MGHWPEKHLHQYSNALVYQVVMCFYGITNLPYETARHADEINSKEILQTLNNFFLFFEYSFQFIKNENRIIKILGKLGFYFLRREKEKKITLIIHSIFN